jgi:hypothetical protein
MPSRPPPPACVQRPEPSGNLEATYAGRNFLGDLASVTCHAVELHESLHASGERVPRRCPGAERGRARMIEDGLTGPELARAMGPPQEEIEGILDDARRSLCQQLLEAGCEFAGEGRRAG